MTVDASSRILVATDSQADAEAILHQLRDEFEHVEAFVDSRQVAKDFAAYAPDVVVLAFEALEDAQAYQLALDEAEPTPAEIGYRTVILCSRSEYAAVIALCKRGHFDDYVLYWPQVYDGYRLTMSVRIACREVVMMKAQRGQPLELLGHARHVDELDRILGAEEGDGERRAVAFRQSAASIESEIAGAVDGFAKRLDDEASAAWVTVRDKGAMSREIDRLKEKQSEAVRRAGAGHVDAMQAQTRHLKDRLEPSLAGVRALADKLRELRPLVMIVEDDEFSRELVSRTLDPQRWRVVFATDGPDAINQLKRMRPDVILMDIRLPGIDGLSLTQQLKASPQLADIPVIMMTGDGRKETLMNSVAAGAAGFVVKPFTRAVLTAKLEKLFPR